MCVSVSPVRVNKYGENLLLHDSLAFLANISIKNTVGHEPKKKYNLSAKIQVKNPISVTPGRGTLKNFQFVFSSLS